MAKIVSGSDGYNADKVAKSIVKQLAGGVPEIWALDVISDKHKFGEKDRNRFTVARGNDDLIGLNELIDEGDYVLVQRIRRTFDMPTFNPRWDHGTADHCYIVDMDKGTVRKANYDDPKDAVHPPNAGVYDEDVGKMSNFDLLEAMDNVFQRGYGYRQPGDTALWNKLLAEARARFVTP